MIQHPIFRRAGVLRLMLVASLAVLASLALFEGCQPACDSLPSESFAQLRILNAVSNSSLLLVYIDGKLFDSAWYDVNNKYSLSNPNHVFGERSSFLSDGSPLRAGQHHVVAIDPGTGASIVWDGTLYDHYQSLIYIGKLHGTPGQALRALYLNDALRAPAGPTFARFVHAVPDILGDTGSLDVYFSDTVKRAGGIAHPDIRIRFGHISHQNPDGTTSDDGTGLSADDYIQFPNNIPGILILPVGDTVLSDAILSVPYSANTSGFLLTVVVRGETKPVGQEPVASAFLLADAYARTILYNVQSFGVRLVNASRYPNLSLLIKGASDPNPRAGVPNGGGRGVLNLGADSVGTYIPLNPDFDGYADYWYSSAIGANSDVEYAADTVFHFHMVNSANERFTYIALDKVPHNSGTPDVDSMILLDSTSAPADPGLGRVRIVNTSPDYTANFSLGGTNFSLKQRDVRFVDVPIGQNISVPVTDGNSHSTAVMFDLTNSQPITIFFMPSNPANPIPYRVSTP